MKHGTYIAVAVLMLFTSATLYSLQLRLDMYKGETAYVEEFMRLPDAEQIKTASLGYELLVADMLWLKAVQHMGEKKITGEGYDWIYKALDTVTTLDPKFISPYEVGGLILTIVAEKADLSNKLLEKGYANNPEVWQLPFYLGFNYFYFNRDYKNAAFYMSRAAGMEGSPSYLPLLVSRLYVQADDPAYALEFLLRMYETTDDDKLKAGMEKRINLLKAEVLVRDIQKIADKYAAGTGHRAESLKELVRLGYLKYIPEEPNGGQFYIDHAGKVRSSKLKSEKELGVHRSGG
ncbi:MAG TPA: hypothetical protein VGB23_05955 [Nitrospirota bacterium]